MQDNVGEGAGLLTTPSLRDNEALALQVLSHLGGAGAAGVKLLRGFKVMLNSSPVPISPEPQNPIFMNLWSLHHIKYPAAHARSNITAPSLYNHFKPLHFKFPD